MKLLSLFLLRVWFEGLRYEEIINMSYLEHFLPTIDMRLIQMVRIEVDAAGLVRFRAKDLRCLANSPSFLSKHALGNPGGYTVYFRRVCEGEYELL